MKYISGLLTYLSLQSGRSTSSPLNTITSGCMCSATCRTTSSARRSWNGSIRPVLKSLLNPVCMSGTMMALLTPEALVGGSGGHQVWYSLNSTGVISGNRTASSFILDSHALVW